MESSAYLPALGIAAVKFSLMCVVIAGLLRLARGRLNRDDLRRVFRVVFILVLYVNVAALVLSSFSDRWGFRGDSKHWGLEKLLAYEAESPFGYRVLSPMIINAGIALVPDAAVQGNTEWLLEKTPLLRFRRPGESWNVEKAVAFHVAYFYMFASLLAALYAARWVTALAAPPSALLVDLGPPIALLFLPMTFHFGGYLYDFAELAWLFVFLGLLIKERWAASSAVLVLATLNKESNILLVLYLLAIGYGRMTRAGLVRHALAQASIGLAAIAIVRYVLADVPVGHHNDWLGLNVLFWLDPRAYFGVIQPYAPLIPTPRGANVLSLFVVGSFVFWGWPSASSELRRLAVVTAVVNLPLLFLLGFLDEIRNLSLMFPAIYLLACHAMTKLWEGARVRPGH